MGLHILWRLNKTANGANMRGTVAKRIRRVAKSIAETDPSLGTVKEIYKMMKRDHTCGRIPFTNK